MELETFFRQWEQGPAYCSVSAFTQRRAKLHPSFFYHLNQLLQQCFYHYYGSQVRRWNGYRLIAVDGSSVSLIKTGPLKDYFGGQRNQRSDFVVAQTLYHYDVLNEIVVQGHIGPYRRGELNMAYDALAQVGEDMLCLYDRNFCSYKMVALHLWQETARKFVIRAKDKSTWLKAFVQSGLSSDVIDMPPTKAAIKGMPNSGFKVSARDVLRVRLVRVELPGTTEVLLTNLWEEDGYDAREFKDLYALRWGIETNIGLQKNVLQLESFSGLTCRAVQQDFYATVLMTNLHSILIKDAQQTVEQTKKNLKYPVKINRNKSYATLKQFCTLLFIYPDIRPVLQLLHDHFAREVIPIRKGRSFPRVKKNHQTKSRFKTMTNFKPAY